MARVRTDKGKLKMIIREQGEKLSNQANTIGEKDVTIAALQAQLEEVIKRCEQLEAAKPTKPAKPAKPEPEPLPPMGLVRKLAYEIFEFHQGHILDHALSSASYKSRAYKSQCAAADGNGRAFGPNITTYESRMTESNISRLMRQRDTLYKRCQYEAIRELQDAAAGRLFSAGDDTPAIHKPKPGGEPEYKAPQPTGDFTDAEITQFVDWYFQPGMEAPSQRVMQIDSMMNSAMATGTMTPAAQKVLKLVKQRAFEFYPAAPTFEAAMSMHQKAVFSGMQRQ